MVVRHTSLSYLSIHCTLCSVARLYCLQCTDAFRRTLRLQAFMVGFFVSFSLCIQNEKCIFQTLFTYTQLKSVFSEMNSLIKIKVALRCFINRTLENSVIELHWTLIMYDKIMQKKSIGDERKYSNNNNRIIAYWTVNTSVRTLTHNRSLLIPAYYANSFGFERKAALEVLIIIK